MKNMLLFLREEIGFSLYTLGEYTHLSPSLLNLLENGKRPFRESHLKTLCNFYDVSSDFLLGNSKEGIGIYSSEDDNANHIFVTCDFYKDLLQSNVGRYRLVRIEKDKLVNVERCFERDIAKHEYAIRRYFSNKQDKIEQAKRKKTIKYIIEQLDKIDDISLEMLKDFVNDFSK